MSDLERLRCLGNCLQQSRKKVYRVILKETRRSGLLRTDPGAVYETTRGRLMEFRETLLEKQNRVEGEYHNCLLYTSPSPRDLSTSRMPSSA